MKTRRLITWICCLIPLIITLCVLPLLPSEIPGHYDISGNVTRYGSKYETLLLPIVSLLMGLFWELMAKVALKDKEKGEQNVKVLFWGSIIMSLVFTVLTIWFLYLSYSKADSLNGTQLDFLKILAVCLSICWVVLGNILPKCKHNHYIGIRTKWTMRSEVSWYKTHRFGGRLFMIGGFLSAIICLFFVDGSIGIWISICCLLVLIIPIIVYSYHVSKSNNH